MKTTKNLPMNLNVMVIDNNEIDLFITKKIISNAGICGNISTYNSALAAIGALENLKEDNTTGIIPDFILLDMNMPEMNGFEFLKAFSKLRDSLKAHVKVYILSLASNRNDVKRQQIGKCCNGFIDKPLDMEKLNAILKHNKSNNKISAVQENSLNLNSIG